MNVLDHHLPQPDRRSCGAAVLVVARMLADDAYAEQVLAGGPRGFRDEVLTRHRAATAIVGPGGPQVPWPRALGTPPWAVARGRSRDSGLPHRTVVARLVWPASRHRLVERIRAAADRVPVPVYVGSRLLPRHVVLVCDPDLVTYDPARGRTTRLDPADLAAGRLHGPGWPVPWFAVLP